MKRIFTLCLVALLLSIGLVMAQAPGPFYRQFYFNPYIFNPAFVGINNELEANISYRQQWTNFKDAPVTAGASIQFPTSERVALGFNLYSDKQVLLQNTNFMATFGYVVPISKNQSLRFALSGGVGLNKLDLTAEELNTNDPAIANAAGNNFYVDGNFGVVYSISGLRIGFALTDLFKSNAFNEQNFNKFEMSNLRNRLFSASYRFNVGVMGNISIEPYMLYRQTEDGLQDSWEAASLVYFKNKIWTGVSYNQNNGLALFFGANLKERIKFGYSYEFPPFNAGFPTTSSHELHIGVRLTKKKPAIAKAAAPAELANVPPATTTPAAQETGNLNPGRIVAADGPNNKDLETPIVLPDADRVRTTEPPTTSTAAPVKTEEIKKTTAKTSKASESFTMSQGHYYVVVGVFSVMSHSMKFAKEMMSKGYKMNVGLNPKNNFYYAYIYSTLDHEDAKRVRNEYRWKNLFKEAWVFSME
jgi:type IX secretion system PorP/SprF family membrane protein